MSLPYEIDVPESLVRHIRIYFGDLPEFNRLIEGTEISDEKLILAIQLWVNHFNKMPPIITEVFADNFPDYLILYHGVIIELLRMSGIIHSRNFLNFNDNGVQFTVNDKASDYMSWISGFLQTHAQDVKDLKVGLNAEEAYNFIESPEAWYPDVYLDS